jgi:hypothetical protein
MAISVMASSIANSSLHFSAAGEVAVAAPFVSFPFENLILTLASDSDVIPRARAAPSP